MADDLGAVRRTPRPTGDRQTPETVAQLPRGATNAPTPVSTDAGNDTGDLSPEVAAALVEQHGPEIQAIADAFHELRGKLHATAVLGHLHTTDNDMQAFLELPECAACGGTGKDNHGSPFEAPLAVHFAGPYVTIGGRRRQLCAWCGHVLLDVQLAPGQEHEPWFDVKLVRVEDGATTRQPYTYGDPLPPGCCALPDDEGQADDGLCSRCSAPAVDDLNFVDPFCRQHLTEAYDAEAAAEDENREADGPDEAQETRAAADWPAEPVDTPAEGDHV